MAEKPLYTAARVGSLDEVKALLNSGVDINSRLDWNGETALTTAATWGHIELVEYLIHAGADVNKGNKMKETPLHCAVSAGHANIVECLVIAGANVNKTNDTSQTPIVFAETEEMRKILNNASALRKKKTKPSHQVNNSAETVTEKKPKEDGTHKTKGHSKRTEKEETEMKDKTEKTKVDKHESEHTEKDTKVIGLEAEKHAKKKTVNKAKAETKPESINHVEETKIKEIVNAAGVALKPWMQGKVMLIGPGRAGKSAFLRALMGKLFSQTASTVGIDELTCEVMQGAFDDNNKWREGENNEKDFESAVAEVIVKGLQVPKQVSKTSHTSSLPSTSAHSKSSSHSSSVVQSQSHDVSSSHQSLTDGSNHEQNRKTVSLLEARDCDADFVYKQITEKKMSSDQSKIKLMMYDFAGQKLFTMFHHFFMTSHGVYCLVFNMEWIISEDELVRNDCIDSIRAWLGAAVMHSWSDESKEAAPIVLVGSRKDIIKSPRDHESISTLLHSVFSYHQAWPSILTNDEATGANGRASFCFYPVDNTLGHDDPTVKKVAKDIEKVLEQSDYVNQKKPLSYYKFLDIIQSLGVIHLSLAEATDIAEKCGVLTDDVVPMLTFLHDMGKLMFHNEVSLRNDVIIKPIQFFVVPATLVVCKHVPTQNDPTLHQLPIHRECMKKMNLNWQSFTKEGILDHKLLLMLLSDYSSSSNTIINLMLKYGLLVKLQRDSLNASASADHVSYIVPALLPIVDSSFTHPDVSTFYFVFTTNNYLETNFTSVTEADLKMHGFLPQGLFERIIGKCVSWSQRTSQNNTLQNCVLGHSSAILMFGALRFQLKLLLDTACIEVNIEGSQPRAVMKRLTEIVKDIISECMNMLHFFVALSCVRYNEEFLIPLSILNTVVEKQSELRKRNGDSILTGEEVRLQYHRWLDLKEQHNEWHVFLSYRWNRFDSPFVSALYDYFSLYKLERNQPVDVFLDTECLQSGKMFQREFASALKNTVLVMLTISEVTLERMVLHNGVEVDNVLVEWLCTIECFESPQSRVSRVCPVFFGHRDDPFGTTDNLFRSDVCLKLPSVIPAASIAKAKELLVENGITPRSAVDSFTVLSLFQQLKSYLCIFAWDTNKFLTPEAIVSGCVLDALVMLKSALGEIKNNAQDHSKPSVVSSSCISYYTICDYQQAWHILHDSNSVVNHKQQELQAFLDGLGFSEAKDLSYFNDLDEADKFKIRGFLKKIPLKKLLKSNVSHFSLLNFNKAWEVLRDPNSVADKDQAALQLFLVNLGAYAAEDLAYLEEEDKAHVQTLLKKIAFLKFTKSITENES